MKSNEAVNDLSVAVSNYVTFRTSSLFLLSIKIVLKCISFAFKCTTTMTITLAFESLDMHSLAAVSWPRLCRRASVAHPLHSPAD